MPNSQKNIAMLAGNGDGVNSRLNYNSAEAQRQRLIDWLRVYGMIDTITARRELDILGVAQRIIELRKRYRIDTVWTEKATDCGQLHRVALYVLRPEGLV